MSDESEQEPQPEPPKEIAPTLARLNRHFLPGLENDHVVNGLTRSREIEAVRMRTAILFDEARIYSGGQMSAETAFEIDSAEYTQDFALRRGEEGFNARNANTQITEDRTVYNAPRQGGFISRLRNRGKKQELTQAQ